MITTTDFFYPLVTDPYLQGRIACCNVLSDLYAMGIERCDTMLMILGISLKMTPEERKIVTREMIRGFNDCATEACTKITGGQTVMNPWTIIGGVGTTICTENDFIRPLHAVPGDLIVLTKPIGTQIAVNVYEWYTSKPEQLAKMTDKPTDEEIETMYSTACKHMATLNKTSAGLMIKHGAHGATDVTGFGILGHATNLAANQTAQVDYVLTTLPLIANTARCDKQVIDFKLVEGYSAETSGGLLVALPAENAEAFAAESNGWIIGHVESGTGTARIAEDVKILEV